MLVAVGLLGMPGAVWSQSMAGQPAEVNADSATPRVAGTAAEFVLALNPYAAEARDTANAALLQFEGNSRWCSNTCSLHVPFNLPSGAIIIGLAVAALDQSASGAVSAQLLRCPLSSSCSLLGPVVSTGVPDQPGLMQVRDNLATPHTVDNVTNSHAVFVSMSGGTNATRLIGLRVFYTLQVSPAPTVATFSDVPTSHPFFRFIEALAASGITAGCGGGNFCPDAPLTRGQMAVFLSIGLGLHFAP
jgi:hypothetical protein